MHLQPEDSESVLETLALTRSENADTIYSMKRTSREFDEWSSEQLRLCKQKGKRHDRRLFTDYDRKP